MVEQAEALYAYLNMTIRDTLFPHCFLSDVQQTNISRLVPMFALQYYLKSGEETFAYQPIIKAVNTAVSAHTICLAPFLVPEATSKLEEDTQIYVYSVTADFDNHEEGNPIPKEKFTPAIIFLNSPKRILYLFLKPILKNTEWKIKLLFITAILPKFLTER